MIEAAKKKLKVTISFAKTSLHIFLVLAVSFSRLFCLFIFFSCFVILGFNSDECYIVGPRLYGTLVIVILHILCSTMSLYESHKTSANTWRTRQCYSRLWHSIPKQCERGRIHTNSNKYNKKDGNHTHLFVLW